jgi:hypothetical protein
MNGTHTCACSVATSNFYTREFNKIPYTPVDHDWGIQSLKPEETALPAPFHPAAAEGNIAFALDSLTPEPFLSAGPSLLTQHG